MYVSGIILFSEHVLPIRLEMTRTLKDQLCHITITEVARNVFEDGIVNWGRVVSLMALGAAMCQSNGLESNVIAVGDSVAGEIASYLLTEHREWMEEHPWVSVSCLRGCCPIRMFSCCLYNTDYGLMCAQGEFVDTFTTLASRTGRDSRGSSTWILVVTAAAIVCTVLLVM